MSTTQIPPENPVATPRPGVPGGAELYDAEHWESAYREFDIDSVPHLLVQLQDDLERARKREALWMSLVIHLLVVIAFVNSDRLGQLLMRRPVMMVSPNDLMRQKELTYLELPPDEQKLTKRPDTNVISDKDRIATSKAPQIDRKQLKQILDSARPGAPGQGMPAPPTPPQPNTPPPQNAQAQQPQQPQPQQPPPSQNPNTNQMAQLRPPASVKPKISFGDNSVSAGTAIEQAARAALANRGSYGGDGGDYGLGQGRQAAKDVGNLDVLSDTMGVDFGPYLARVVRDVRLNWYSLIPEAASWKKGKVAIEFAIMKDGTVAGMTLGGTSGDVALDRAAWAGITASNPFPPLPSDFKGQFLSLRFRFYYNMDKAEMQ